MTTTAPRTQPTGLRLAVGRASWTFRRATASLRLRPTFLIVGAQKSGTTSLHRYLSENPAVLLAAPKEVRSFHRNHQRGERWYRAHFPLRIHARLTPARADVTPAIGEASPIYLFDPRAPARVHAFDPSMKLIALLRDPSIARTPTARCSCDAATRPFPSRRHWTAKRRWSTRSSGWSATALPPTRI